MLGLTLCFCQVLRTRLIPLNLRPKHALALPLCRNPMQLRWSSTAQDTRDHQVNDRTSAILHGKTKKNAEHTGFKKPDNASMQKVPQHQQAHSTKQKANVPGRPQTTRHPSHPQGKPEPLRSKRRAEEHTAQRPAQRRARPSLKDEAYIRSKFHIPTSQDYPELPNGFFKTVKPSVNDAIQGLAELHADFIELAKQGPHQCTLHYDSAARHEVVVGEGMTQKAAEQAAYLQLVASFHEQGILKEVLDRKSGLNQINQVSMKKEKEEEKDAMMDIYNYAARFDAVPKVGVEVTSMKQRGRQRQFIEVTVELLEQGIKVKGRGSTPLTADINAGKLFKEEAERYHALRGSEAIIIKDSGALTTDNASQFIDFYKIIRPGIKIDFESQRPTRSNIARQWSRIQVKINDEPVGEAAEMEKKKKAESTACLTACIALKKKQPDLLPRFFKALKSGNGQILKPVSPIDFNVDDDCSLVMRETLLAARKAGLPDEVDDVVLATAVSKSSRERYRESLSPNEMERRNSLLKQKRNFYLQNEKYADLRNKIAELPMNQYSRKVLDLVNNNVYSIIVGATGSGKTTQVPQILLEEAIMKRQGAACNIICTQPRRIAATSVARRVAEERAEPLQETVGYHVRFDSKLPQNGGSLTYCTTGILLQQLQHQPDDIMDHNSHLVIDEVHERDMQIDFLLILLKKIISRRKAQGAKVPQVVLMSATMDTELFAAYFQSEIPGEQPIGCPSLSVPGRTFPVKERYLDEIVKDMRATSSSSQLQAMHNDPNSNAFLGSEDRHRVDNPTTSVPSASKDEVSVIDWKRERKSSLEDGGVSILDEKENALIPFGLVACTIAHIAKTSKEGAILVFLPGLAEITRVEEKLMQHNFGVEFRDQSKFKIFMLHSSIPTSQTTVFDPVPTGCRKIILATNIAETSVTIPDVQYVVDTGKLREKQYDQQRRISQLLCTWISKSNAKQRAGRAGRVQNGNYYALYTKQRYESLRAIGLPELLRVDLQEICLNIKAQAFKTPIRDFLAEAIEPPSAKAVDASVNNLEALDCLTDEEEITPLGRLLSSLPVHPTLGKMIVLGIIFRCLDPMLLLGAASAERALFVNPLDARQKAQEVKLSFVEGSGSDHIALLNAVRELRRVRHENSEYATRDFAIRNFLHFNAFKTIESTAEQIADILVDAGLIPPTRQRFDYQIGDPVLNQNSHKVPLIKALLLAGVHPNLAVMATGGRAFRTPGERNTIVHPSSVNAIRERDRANDKNEPAYKRGAIYSYSSMARANDGNSLFLRDTTESTPLMVSLFGGKLKRNNERGNILEVDNWLPFYVNSTDRRTAKTVFEFRKAIERLLVVAFRDLGQLSANRRQRAGFDENGRGTFLADEKIRELFAEGLVEVLDRDVKAEEKTARTGWGTRPVMSGTVTRGPDRGSYRGYGLGDGERGRSGKPAFYADMMKI